MRLKAQEYFDTTPFEEWLITGVALYLDTTRETLLDYESGNRDLQPSSEEYDNTIPLFSDTVKWIKQKVQMSYESGLRKNGRAGDIFGLKNFGWRDKIETDVTSGGERLGAVTPIDPVLIKQWTEFLEQHTLSSGE